MTSAKIFAKVIAAQLCGEYWSNPFWPKYDPLVLMYSISENILTILDNFLSIIIQFFQKMSTAMATLVEGAMKLSRAFCSSSLSNIKQF
jgi:hypothetical protein